MVVLLGSLLCGQAHGPFDNSSQLIVHDDTLEVVVTMGMDGARQFLLHKGLSEPEAAAVLAGRGPSTGAALAVDLAAKFFEVEAGRQPLLAKSVSLMSDGLEAAFTISYPRPATADVRLHALYFNGIEAMKPGSFIATDENRNALAGAMLSRAKTSIELRLSTTAPIAPPLVETVKQESPSALAVTVPLKSETRSASSWRQGVNPLYIGISALFLLVAVFWITARRLTRST